MDKYLEDEIERRYKKIFRKLYISYMQDLKKEYETLVTKGLNTSGHAVGIMYNVIEKLTVETISNINDMIKDIDKEFGEMPLKAIKDYIEKSKKDLNGHIDTMKEKALENFKNEKLLNNESSEIRITNIKGNATYELNQIYLKYRNIKKFRKIEWLLIVNTIATVGGFIVSIIALFI